MRCIPDRIPGVARAGLVSRDFPRGLRNRFAAGPPDRRHRYPGKPARTAACARAVVLPSRAFPHPCRRRRPRTTAIISENAGHVGSHTSDSPVRSKIHTRRQRSIVFPREKKKSLINRPSSFAYVHRVRFRRPRDAHSVLLPRPPQPGENATPIITCLPCAVCTCSVRARVYCDIVVRVRRENDDTFERRSNRLCTRTPTSPRTAREGRVRSTLTLRHAQNGNVWRFTIVTGAWI